MSAILILDLPGAVVGLARLLRQVLCDRRSKPLLFLPSKAGNQPLHFHAEHRPNRDSRIRLYQERDALGLRRVSIHMQFTDRDGIGAVRAHASLERALKEQGIAELIYRNAPEERAAAVVTNAFDGFHQIGSTRMAASPGDGVVDADCRVFEFGNLFIAGSSVFPTSGQANPTYSAVALGLRLSAHLERQLRAPTAHRTRERLLQMTARFFPQASRLGFGCASLGSRIGAAKGIAALEQAFGGGVNWFDLAPSYGDGAAEAIFARFARGRRDRIHICTKHGIEPARHGTVARFLKPLAQRAVSAVPALRRVASRSRSSPRPLPLSSRGIRDGLDSSLMRLATDYVDVFALHDPDPAMLDRDDIRCTLEDFVRSGKARAAGIAGSVEAAVVALQAGLPIEHVQIANPPLAESPARLLASAGPDASYFLATHSIYGRTDPLQVLLARAGSRSRLGALLTAYGYTAPIERAARAAVLDRALATNPRGVILLSMFTAAHLKDNLARLHQGSPRQAEALFQELATIDHAPT